MAVIAPILSTFDSKGVKDAEKAFGSLEKKLKTALGVAALVQFGRASINAAEESEQAAARIAQITKQMGLFEGQTAEVIGRMEDYAASVSKATGIDDEQISAIQAKLLTFRSLAETADEVGGAFDRTTKAAIDLAAAGFGEAEGNAVLLAKALEDPVKGLSKLERAIGPLTKAQRDNIITLTKQNDLYGAQRALLAAVEGRVGGVAEETATSSAKLAVAFDQLQEQIGAALLPVFEQLVVAFQAAVNVLGLLPGQFQTAIIVGVALAASFGKVKSALVALKLTAAQANIAFAGLAVATELFFALAGGAKTATDSVVGFAGEIDRLSDQAALKQFNDLLNETRTSFQNWESQTLFGAERPDEAKAQQAANDFLKDFAKNNLTAARRVLDLMIANGAAKDDVNALALAIYEESVAVSNLEQNTGTLATTTTDAADATQVLVDASKKITDELQAQKDAYDDALDAKLGFFNADIAARNAQRDVADSLDELNGIFKDISEGDYEGTMRDIAQAQDDFLSSALDSAAAQAELKRKAGDSAGATQAQIDELKRVQSLLAPGSPLRAALQGYIDDLTILQTVGGPLIPLLGLDRSEVQRRTGGILIEGNAQGGNVYGGTPSIVGENGPELFVPQSAGYIVPNQRLGGRAAGGNVYNITVNGAVDASSTARQIRQLLQQDGQRLNLPTPVPA